MQVQAGRLVLGLGLGHDVWLCYGCSLQVGAVEYHVLMECPYKAKAGDYLANLHQKLLPLCNVERC